MTPRGPGAPVGSGPRYLRNVWGYHAFNLAIHLAAALTLFGVIRRTLLSPGMRDHFGQAAIPLAFAVALLWVVHPLQTESVTYIVQRVESLMGLFYLLTLYCAIRAWDASEASSRLWVFAAIVACALGMGSKEVMVSAPLIVVLWDAMFATSPGASGRGPWASFRRRWPLYAGLASTWLILALLVYVERRGQSVGFDLGGWTPVDVLVDAERGDRPLPLARGCTALARHRLRMAEGDDIRCCLAGVRRAVACARGHDRRGRATAPAGICWRRLLSDACAVVERLADRDGDRGRASDVSSARRDSGNHRHRSVRQLRVALLVHPLGRRGRRSGPRQLSASRRRRSRSSS